MRIDCQIKAAHNFHMYSVRDRVDLAQYKALLDVTLSDLKVILPTGQDQDLLCIILIARTLTKHMPLFRKFGGGLERHLVHEWYSKMSPRSEVVNVINFIYRTPMRSAYIPRSVYVIPIQWIPFGILLKSETKYEDMLGIMDHLHRYVPTVTLDYSYVDLESTEIVVPVNHIHQIMVYI